MIMNRTFLAISISFCLLATTVPAQQKGQLILKSKKFDEEIIKARDLITQLMTEKKIPGLSITVAQNEEFLWAEGFGFADLEKNTPVSLDTKFRIGSISKSLTALAIGDLIQNDVINLEDNINRYIKYFPEKSYPITIRHLANHTGGIRNYNYRKGEYLSVKHYETVKESTEIFIKDSLEFEPGSKYAYTTYGYTLLSAVIEGATQKGFLSYMDEQILKPMKMFNTVPDDYYEIIENRSEFYDESKGEIVNGYYVDNSNKWAGGGYLSTTTDLALMAQNLIKGEFLNKKTVETLWTPGKLVDGSSIEYGIGWKLGEEPSGRRYVFHGGSSIGGRSFLIIYPNDSLSIAICSNLSTHFDQKLTTQIADLFLNNN